MDKKRAIEIALLYIPTMLGDEADLGITYKDLEEVPNVLKEMLNDYEQGRADAIDDFYNALIEYNKYHYFDELCEEDLKMIAEQLKEQNK